MESKELVPFSEAKAGEGENISRGEFFSMINRAKDSLTDELMEIHQDMNHLTFIEYKILRAERDGMKINYYFDEKTGGISFQANPKGEIGFGKER